MEELYKDFITHKVSVGGKLEVSMQRYVSHIKHFIDTMEIKNTNEIDTNKIYEWLIILDKDFNNEPSSRNIKLTAVKEFVRFLDEVKKEKIDHNIYKIKPAKVRQDKESKFLTVEQVNTMEYLATNLKMKAIISILFHTGLRVSELVNLECKDVEADKTIITGKGGKNRVIGINPHTLKLCRDYIATERADVVEKYNLDTNLLFLTNGGKKIDIDNLRKSLKNYAKKAGVTWHNEVSPHKFRHGFISNQLEKGVPISFVRDMAGHSNIATTNIYAHSNEAKIVEIMKQSGMEEYYGG